MVAIDLGDGGDLLPIVDMVSGYDLEQCAANARLIAAAPDLLKFAEITKQVLTDAQAAGLHLDRDKLDMLGAATQVIEQATQP